MKILIEKYRMLLAVTPTTFIRYLHNKIEWNSRLIAILGARGVGKSTLLLQRIKLYENIEETLFVYADDLYFSKNTLYDLAVTFYQNGGKKLYIDEIHKYKGWSVEIKNIYDLLPNLNVVYTGSSILDLEKDGADLSRRKLQYYMYGLSFREYLFLSENIKVPIHTLKDVLANKIQFPYEKKRPIQLFKNYLQQGYYPFFYEKGYHSRLRNVINQTLEIDIPLFANMNVNTTLKLRKLLYIIAESVPFKPNFTKIAKELDSSRNDIKDILYYLEKAGIINQLRTDTQGIKLLGKVDKVYLDNPNLAYAISQSEPNIGNIRETIFYSWLKVVEEVKTSRTADFSIGKHTFEIGGKNKTQQQIANTNNAYLVKDDIEYGFKNTIPLWAFGFIY